MLPREYTRVEWIESTGSQYIDTGVYANQDTRIVMTAIPMSVAETNGTDGFVPYGAGQSYNSRAFECYTSGGRYQFNYGAQNSFIGSPMVDDKLEIEHNKNAVTVISQRYGTITAAFSYSAFTTPYTVTLFAINRPGAKYGGKLKLDACGIYANGTQIRDYIPFTDASSIANLWDDINLTPATKSGTFLYGPAVIPSAPANLAHSISDGTVALTWTAADEYSNHYKIVRDGIELADIDGDVFAYIDTTAEAGAAHTYKVVACNGTQDGGASSVTVQLPLLIPQILAALITPNPATINQKITITVTVSEIEKILEPTYFYSGEIYAGEV